MIPHLFYYQLMVLGLLWLCVMLHYAWPSRGVAAQQRPATPITPRRQRSKEPQPFAGLTQKPHCALCDQAAPHPKPPPPLPPDPMHPTKRRPRVIDTSRHFCPHGNGRYRGWLGAGNLQANGHPSGGPWRQFHCTACKGSFLETHGTRFHGKRGSVELIVRVIACLAEEAAEQLRAFSGYFLCDVHVRQLQLDELFALLSAVKDGEVSEAEASERLERSPHWVWVATDPES